MANISITNPSISNSETADVTKLTTNDNDIVNGLTDGTKDISVSQGTFAGLVKVADGTAAAPEVTFASDTDTGLYRIGADNIGITTAGAKQVDINSNGVISMPNQSYVWARHTTTQTITALSNTTVIFDGEVIDNRGEYDNATGVFTCVVPGFYLVIANLRYNDMEDGKFITAGIRIDATVLNLNKVYAPGTTTDLTVSVSGVINLTAGQTVDIRTFTDRATDGVLGASYTNLSIIKVA